MATKKEQVQDIIENTRGRFFGCTFEKKCGELREINAQFRRKDNNPPHWNPLDKGMMIVWDAQKQSFRTITLGTVQRVAFDNKTIEFD